MQLIFISGSLRRSSRQVALLAGSRNTFTQTFVPFSNIDNSLIGYPDYNNIETIITKSGTYTIQKNGWISAYFSTSANTNCGISINGTTIVNLKIYNSNYWCNIPFVPVKKGDVIAVYGSANDATIKFCPNITI